MKCSCGGEIVVSCVFEGKTEWACGKCKQISGSEVAPSNYHK